MAAVAALLGDGFADIGDGMSRQAAPGRLVARRLEVVHHDPTVVLDGAHNPHGARTAVPACRSLQLPVESCWCSACLEDKDVDGIVPSVRARSPTTSS